MNKDALGHWWTADRCTRCGKAKWSEASQWPCAKQTDEEREEQPSIMDDVLKLIETLQRDKKYGAPLMYYPDAVIIAMGGDPNDYPELEGYPGVRVVRATE